MSKRKKKKNDKREEISCKIQTLSKSWVRVTGDTAWVVQPSMSKSVEKGYGIMIMIINYILKVVTTIYHFSNQTHNSSFRHKLDNKSLLPNEVF